MQLVLCSAARELPSRVGNIEHAPYNRTLYSVHKKFVAAVRRIQVSNELG